MSRSVVVVSMRCGDWLEPCLGSVREQADQLVVVDNGSAGAEVSVLARRFGATVVRNGENQGFAGGANRGIRQATGDIVALLNDDALAGPSWLDEAEDTLADRSVQSTVDVSRLLSFGRHVDAQNQAIRPRSRPPERAVPARPHHRW